MLICRTLITCTITGEMPERSNGAVSKASATFRASHQPRSSADAKLSRRDGLTPVTALFFPVSTVSRIARRPSILSKFCPNRDQACAGRGVSRGNSIHRAGGRCAQSNG